MLSEPLVSTPNTWEPAALAGLCGAENVTGWAQREAERLPLAASRSESRTGAMEKREKKKASPEGREEPQKQRDQSSELTGFKLRKDSIRSEGALAFASSTPFSTVVQEWPRSLLGGLGQGGCPTCHGGKPTCSAASRAPAEPLPEP